jgi:membrane protein DedA with SNARE-associated domain
MVAETQVNPPNGSSAPLAMARNTGELLSDALTLTELQGKLLALDLQDDLSKLITPLILLAAGAVLALSCLPLALVTIAFGLVAGAHLEPWLALLIALAIGLACAACLVAAGAWYLRSQLTFLSRSRVEWKQNVQWFKSVVRRLGANSRRPAAPGHERAH